MKNQWLLDISYNSIKQDDFINHSFYAALSLAQEALIIVNNFKKHPQNIVIVKENAYQATKLYEQLTAFLADINLVLYVPEESLRVEAIASSYENMASRVDAMYQLLNNEYQVVVTYSSAIIKYLPQPKYFFDSCVNLHIGNEIGMNKLKRHLIDIGYNQVTRVEHPLTFSVRGGIVDVFSINYQNPIRIEFFDTEVDSIREFDVNSQRTINKINQVTIIPATDLLYNEEEIETIVNVLEANTHNQELMDNLSLDIEYLKSKNSMYHLYIYNSLLANRATILDYIEKPLVALSTASKIEYHLHNLLEETTVYIQEMAALNKMLLKFNVFADYHREIVKYQVVKNDVSKIGITNIIDVNVPHGNTSYIIDVIEREMHNKIIVFIVKASEIKILDEILLAKDIPYQVIADKDVHLVKGINIIVGSLASGFELVKEDTIIYTSKELFHHHVNKGRYVNKFKESKLLDSYKELNPGDFVVHNQYGIGKFIAIVTKEFKGIHHDYLQIVYAGNDELFVPLEQFHLVRKFVSKEGASPRLNKLGSNKWQKTKEKLQENIDDIAEKLIDLYALRQEKIGYKYDKDSPMQKDFDNDFEFELTEDQKKSVQEIKADMESDLPMDRLLCGDVGFGKTEVASRAAFKAVDNNKQVAFLCPTTILSLQHYKTITARFANFPVKIAVLNRFVIGSEVKKIIQDLKDGKIDVLIGTHRILSNDIKFKDLGLLIIDEEQRFGVQHKEKIKVLKQSIDVLSLSATPIPRTLQMSLIGIRQLSTLDTPPNNRYPVQTYVVEKTPGLIVEAISRELQRDGQVFYLYNNIEQIYATARMIQKEIKDARVAVAHGKMTREEIEDIMLSFYDGEYNVLVCTTIIETGIDIPNANTILIENAHLFGLSQLYQIKGRVGRSDRIAYAYLLIPEKKQVAELAEKRLKAIKEFAQLGSGYKIAMRDLTIRGAGDLLGANQSGFIDTVGIDMYMEMLNASIKKKKGISEKPKKTKITSNLNVDGYIPEDYAPVAQEKIDVYKTIEKIDNLNELKAYQEALIDQNGKMNTNVKYLFEKKYLDILINDDTVEKLHEKNSRIYITFTQQYSDKVDGIKMFELFTNVNRNIKISYKQNKISVEIPKTKNNLDTAIKIIETSKDCVKDEN